MYTNGEVILEMDFLLTPKEKITGVRLRLHIMGHCRWTVTDYVVRYEV